MNDDAVLAALSRVESKLDHLAAKIDLVEARLGNVESKMDHTEARLGRIEVEQTRLREQVNGKLDDILDKLKAMREDVDTVRAHVLYGLPENLTLSQRISKLEDQMRRH